MQLTFGLCLKVAPKREPYEVRASLTRIATQSQPCQGIFRILLRKPPEVAVNSRRGCLVRGSSTARAQPHQTPCYSRPYASAPLRSTGCRLPATPVHAIRRLLASTFMPIAAVASSPTAAFLPTTHPRAAATELRCCKSPCFLRPPASFASSRKDAGIRFGRRRNDGWVGSGHAILLREPDHHRVDEMHTLVGSMHTT